MTAAQRAIREALERLGAHGVTLPPGAIETYGAACARLKAVQEAWEQDGEPVTSTGSTGQTIVHPLLGEIRKQERHVAALRRDLWLGPRYDNLTAAYAQKNGTPVR